MRKLVDFSVAVLFFCIVLCEPSTANLIESLGAADISHESTPVRPQLSGVTMTVWDEAIDGDLSNDELNPTPVALGLGHNVVTGTIGGAVPGEAFDAFTITIGLGQALQSVVLDAYVPTGGNTSSGFNIIRGTSWDGNLGNTNVVGSASSMTVGNVGADLLSIAPFPGPLGADDYVVALREGTAGQQYSLNFTVVPEPSPLLYFGLLIAAGVPRSARWFMGALTP